MPTRVPNLPLVETLFAESIRVKQAVLADQALLADIAAVVEAVVETYRAGGKVLLAGNGGSAADAQHIAAELVCRFMQDRPALPAIALTTDSSVMTATSNDLGYERIFSRQVEALGQPGDALIAISTSGNSPNILAALASAGHAGLKRIALTGSTGGEMAARCDLVVQVPSTDTARIQETHILIGHVICAAVEQALFTET